MMMLKLKLNLRDKETNVKTAQDDGSDCKLVIT